MSNDIKPCPFCGSKAGRVQYALPYMSPCPGASCMNECCGMFGIHLPLDAWNTRAPVRVKLPQWWHEDSQGQLCLSYDAIITALKAQGVEVIDG